jgi:molecular chaperone GrpE
VSGMNDEQIGDEIVDPVIEDESSVDEVESPPEQEDEPLTLEKQLAAAQAEAARNLDGWQRTQAEFANARKRFDKQRIEIYNSAGAELAGKLLPIIDDFERALETAPPNDGSNDAWVEGILLVHRKLLSTLEEMGVQIIPAVGEPFDPNVHEALMQEPSDVYPSGTVTREMRRGYRLGDRVIRPSLVVVAE